MRGHVRKRGNKWAVVVDVGQDPTTGKRRQKWYSGHATEQEAHRALTKILSSMDAGAYVEPSKLTVGAYLTDEWLPAVRASLRPSTHESYTRAVRVHLEPGIGSIPLQALSPAALNAFYAGRLLNGRRDGEGLSPRSVRYLHSILHKALADAMKWGRVLRNVADLAEPPSAKRAKARPPKTWSADELRAFLSHVHDDRLYALWLVYATTGVRRGEPLGAHWSDLDLNTGRLAIREASVSVAYKIERSEPKSDRGRRNVALDPATVAALRDWRKAQVAERLAFGPAYSDESLIFCREDGQPIHPERVSDMFAGFVKATGLPRMPLKSLRHTWASLALQAGVNPKVVSERLGHATVSFTLDTYSHVMPGMQQDAADTVAGLILGA